MANSAPLDPSQPKDAHIAERLAGDPIAWITSVRPDGRPHAVPVWFLWEEAGTLLLFSKPDQKVRNLQANPNVLIALDNTQAGSDVVVFEGTATLLDNANRDWVLPPAYAAKYQEDIDRFGWTPEGMAAQYSQPIRITPTGWLFR